MPSGVRRPLQRLSAAASYACCAPTTAAEFTSYCVDEGVQRHYSTPYSPQQDGVVERLNQTVVGMARAILKQRGMSAVF
jgi:transposase InsO family protein